MNKTFCLNYVKIEKISRSPGGRITGLEYRQCIMILINDDIKNITRESFRLGRHFLSEYGIISKRLTLVTWIHFFFDLAV